MKYKCKELLQFDNKKTTHRKVDKRYEWTIHRRANTNDKKAYKPMLIFSAVRNANSSTMLSFIPIKLARTKKSNNAYC